VFKVNEPFNIPPHLDSEWVDGVCAALKKQLLPSIVQMNTLLAFARKKFEQLPNVLRLSIENEKEITLVV
jgi:hypothetical protein